MIPQVSIVIPCYNSETTLEETLTSVYNQEFDEWEALMINDGSPDNLETIALKWVEKDPRFKYFKKENGGLGTARNYGINKAKGAFILPLDSDNKVSPKFLEKGLQIFNSNPSVGVVYGNALFFGERQGVWKVGHFEGYKMLEHNYIDACTLIRKSVFDTLGLYDDSMPHQGHEDWDLWLRVMGSNYTFHYLKEITFEYRVTHDSMIKSFDEKMLNENIDYIKKKHYKLYIKAFSELYNKSKLIKKNHKKDTFLKKVKRKLKL